MEWMAWTWPTAAFFLSIAVLIGAMTVSEFVRPTEARRGILPVVTTRGDRFFIGLLTAAFVNLAWILLLDFSQWWALLLCVPLALVILWRG